MKNLKEYYFTCSPRRYDKMVRSIERNRPKFIALIQFLNDLCEDYGYDDCDISTVYDPFEQKVVLGIISDVPKITEGWRTLNVADLCVKLIPEWLLEKYKVRPNVALLNLVKVPELLNDFALLAFNDIPFLTYYRNLGTVKISTNLDLSAYDMFHTNFNPTLH